MVIYLHFECVQHLVGDFGTLCLLCLVKAASGTWVRSEHVPEHLVLIPALILLQAALPGTANTVSCMPGWAEFFEAVHVAAGTHPLQRSFRAATAELLGKYGVPVSKQTQAELEAESDGSEEDSGSGQPSKILISSRPPSCHCTGPLCLLQHTFATVMNHAARSQCAALYCCRGRQR